MKNTLRGSIVGITLCMGVLASAPALATKGSDAVAMCNARPGCQVKNGPNGTITIVVNGHLIWCADTAEGDCQVIYKTGPGGEPGSHGPATNVATAFGDKSSDSGSNGGVRNDDHVNGDVKPMHANGN
jgi:hypothetical protein